MDEQHSELNHKRELFARAYLKHGNGAQAVIDAGYDVSSRESAAAMAWTLLQDPVIQQFLSEQKSIVASRQEINLEWNFKKLKEIVEVHSKKHEIIVGDDKVIGEKMIDAKVVISALDMISKQLGFYEPEKVEHKVNAWSPDKEILKNFTQEF